MLYPLIDEAQRLAANLSVDYLELRQREPANEQWPGKDLYVTFRKEIDPDPEVNMKAIPRKQRRMVRQGIKAGLAIPHGKLPGLDHLVACVGLHPEGIDFGAHLTQETQRWAYLAQLASDDAQWDHYEQTYADNARRYVAGHPEDPDAPAMGAHIEP